MKTILFNPGNDITDAKYIRTKVFIEEQGFSIEGEFDDTDNLAHHLVYYNEDDKPIATCRFFNTEQEPEIYHFGRLSVLKEYRKCGLGKKMIDDMQKEAQKLGASSFWLSAQSTAVGFYEKSGFEICGEEYLDEHCPHYPMEKKL